MVAHKEEGVVTQLSCNFIADFTSYQCWNQNLALKSILQTTMYPRNFDLLHEQHLLQFSLDISSSPNKNDNLMNRGTHGGDHWYFTVLLSYVHNANFLLFLRNMMVLVTSSRGHYSSM